MRKKDGTWIWTIDEGKVIKIQSEKMVLISMCSDMAEFIRRKDDLEKKIYTSDRMKKMPGGCSKRPIIAMSANAFEKDIRGSIEASLNAHLVKPMDRKKDDRYHETVPGKQNRENRMMISFLLEKAQARSLRFFFLCMYG